MVLTKTQIELLRSLEPGKIYPEPEELSSYFKEERKQLAVLDFVQRGYLNRPNSNEYCITIRPNGVAFLETLDADTAKEESSRSISIASLIISGLAVTVSIIALLGGS